MAVYDTIGTTYATTRRGDARIERQIADVLEGMRTVVNVGAGTGSYEPSSTVLAIEPSAVMIAQRPDGAAPALRAAAEALPLQADAADAALACLTIHHWNDLAAGIAELRRIATRRIVVFTWDQAAFGDFWLATDYLPEAGARSAELAVPMDRLVELLGGADVVTVPVPHDCTDGFGAAYWRRPHAYLDPAVRAQISSLATLDEEVLRPGLRRLDADLTSGRWHDRHAHLLREDTLDIGYRLVVADLA